MNTLLLVLQWIGVAIAAWGIGWLGASAIEALAKQLAIVARLLLHGVGPRLCVPCGGVTPALLRSKGRWTCSVCGTPHPDHLTRR